MRLAGGLFRRAVEVFEAVGVYGGLAIWSASGGEGKVAGVAVVCDVIS
jgi:hypothetical protein